MAENDKPIISQGSGALVSTMATERSMNLYGVVEPELDRLSALSTEANAFLSVGGGFVGYAAEWFRDWWVNGTEGAVPFFIAFGGLGLVALAFGCLRAYQRRSYTGEIKKRALPRKRQIGLDTGKHG